MVEPSFLLSFFHEPRVVSYFGKYLHFFNISLRINRSTSSGRPGIANVSICQINCIWFSRINKWLHKETQLHAYYFLGPLLSLALLFLVFSAQNLMPNQTYLESKSYKTLGVLGIFSRRLCCRNMKHCVISFLKIARKDNKIR